MNIQQLEYIVAVDTHRHFVTAAEKCFVTQATLSIMIKKLEEELDVKIFDRTKQPVIPTEIGEKVIAQAKIILQESRKLAEIVKEDQLTISGELKIGIIPTLAPYLLPLFLHSFMEKYPLVKLVIHELTTQEIIHQLKQNTIDVGILATPLKDEQINEIPLFTEDLFVLDYAQKSNSKKKNYILPKEIDIEKLWLLEEGHCLRSQIINLCEMKEQQEDNQLVFSTGSIETLKKVVKANNGITILPNLALNELNEQEKKHVFQFKNPAPAREIGLVYYRFFVKERLIKALENEIILHIPDELKSIGNKVILPMD